MGLMLPIVAEEGLASINAAKLAKKHLNQELYKKMNKINFKAFSSYFFAMILTGIGTYVANYIKDGLTGGLKLKQAAQDNNAKEKTEDTRK